MVEVKITDLTGKTVKSLVLDKDQHKQTLELGNGFYIFTAKSGSLVQNDYRYINHWGINSLKNGNYGRASAAKQFRYF